MCDYNLPRSHSSSPLTCLLVLSPAAIIGGMTEVTRILIACDRGDPSAAKQQLPLVYEELRKLAAQKLAQEAPGQTLQATAEENVELGIR
jgi:hypothetical protein